MLYTGYDIQRGFLASAGWIAQKQADFLNNFTNSPLNYGNLTSVTASALDVFAHSVMPRGKPAFDLKTVEIDGKHLQVEEQNVARKPFGQLKHFTYEGSETKPKLLICAPMSGHFATLLRGTVERMLPTHDVYITDWKDARDVPLTGGGFDLESYIDYLVEWLEFIGPDAGGRGAHMLAVCQPSVPAYAAAAIMSANKHPLRPRTLTMMGGPIDTREAPTAVNDHATRRPHDWFVHNVIATVPPYYKGAGRRVYPGWLQLSGFMSMNLGNHMISHWSMFSNLVEGDGESADRHKDFYDEYRAVCDMTAEFYLQTVDTVFQRHLLPKGEFNYRGKLVDPGAIEDIALLAIEGERDDISGIGQTKAALTIATGLPEAMKQYHMAPEVGHYGIFNGSKWREKIAPIVEEWILAHNG
ncbi:polyhydroxyalkanoate depolymerase [Sphingorhabdus sp.]|uniref:polyhydroxyalkanoate depolymerase n=1 Tax=Sphingorhabdus sp. TaxID=1902408 RepID=UPI0032B72AFA